MATQASILAKSRHAGDVTDEEGLEEQERMLQECRREYFKRRMAEAVGTGRGCQTRFAEATGIARSDVTDVLREEINVTDLMLVKIAKSIGPPIGIIYNEIAKLCIAKALDLGGQRPPERRR